MGNCLSLPLPFSSFGGVGGPDWRFVYLASLGGVGGRSSLFAVSESFGGVGGGLRGCSLRSLDGSNVRCGRDVCEAKFDSVLRALRPPVLDDSTASSTTGKVVPSSPRSADGLRRMCIERSGTSSSVSPLCRERSACSSAFSMTVPVASLSCCVTFTPLSWGPFAALAASSRFSRSAASRVFVTALMNFTKRSPYRSGGMAEI